MRKIFLDRSGFTLIELLTVIAIIAILGAVVAPNLFRAVDRSKVSAVLADSRAIKSAATAYYSDTGEWPPDKSDGTDPGFTANPEDGIAGWSGPYLESWPAKNPWNGKYCYRNGESGVFGGKACYLQLDKVPEDALDELIESLGDKAVKKDVDYVYILISQE
ncbi:MAG: prepilin-type N-terminal cleavage/methylation domain-containing protein [Firmicutes bacterium]|mgnify:CR=1 FL=1|jgi:general secretion pathway protein G|nr:prepilin-type N-terminal cleavage/methylation domain-containing protein [Bacillota bacterium]